jgi:hypothetical protein
MRRGGRAVAERAALRDALESLQLVCPDCGSRSCRIEWNSSHRRYRLIVLHVATCPVLLSGDARLRHSIDRWIRDALVAQGRFYVADYCDDLTGLHRPIPSGR